jgi:hypothetical protein
VIRLIVGGVFGLALVVFVAVIDTELVVRAYNISPSSSLTAIVIGTAAAAATVAAFAWYRTRVRRLSPRSRRILGWAGIAWAAMFVAGFAWTHPRHRNDESFTSPLEVAVICYCLIIIVVAVCLVPFAILSLSRRAPHSPHDRVQVAGLRDKRPYFVAYCECGWVGTAYNDDEPDAQDKAFQEARAHGTNVASEVQRTW